MIKLIDGSNMLHRALYNMEGKLGVHPLRELYLRFMAADANTIIVWDGMHSNKRRRDLYPAYKTRPEKGEDIKASFDIMKQVLCYCPVMQIEIPYWEADDVLYTLACMYREGHTDVSIETNDQDFWQLAGEFITLPLVKPLPCEPRDTCLYKALCGDSSDTIPGWRGFGPAKWTAIQDHIDEVERCLVDRDLEGWKLIPWPKGITVSEESFFQCCIYLQVVTMLTVPDTDFDDNYICGKSNAALVEEIFAKWRI